MNAHLQEQEYSGVRRRGTDRKAGFDLVLGTGDGLAHGVGHAPHTRFATTVNPHQRLCRHREPMAQCIGLVANRLLPYPAAVARCAIAEPVSDRSRTAACWGPLRLTVDGSQDDSAATTRDFDSREEGYTMTKQTRFPGNRIRNSLPRLLAVAALVGSTALWLPIQNAEAEYWRGGGPYWGGGPWGAGPWAGAGPHSMQPWSRSWRRNYGNPSGAMFPSWHRYRARRYRPWDSPAFWADPAHW